MNWLNQSDLLNWDAIAALAAWIEIMILFFPTVAYFMYLKVNYVSYWVFNQNLNGMNIAVHNKSKTSLFILKEEIVVKNINKYDTKQLPLLDKTKYNYLCIKPNEIIIINIDYAIYKISASDKIILKIQFGGKHRIRQKKIKRD